MLGDLVRQTHPGVPVNDPNSKANLWINSRWLPSKPCCPPQVPCKGIADDEPAWALVPPGRHDLDSVLEIMQALPSQDAGGAMVRFPWDLVDRNGAEIVRDVAACATLPTSQRVGLVVVGPAERVFIEPSARLDPLVVLDVSQGPVIIQEGAAIHAFSR